VNHFQTGSRRAVDWLIPKTARRSLMRHARRLAARPRVGRVNFGDLRRLAPVCLDWGFSRGTPVDRHYIDGFMARHADDIHGRVLEVGTNEFTLRYGAGRVTRGDVLHVASNDPPVTIVADLTLGTGLPVEAFDCVIATQTFQFIYDVHSVIRTLHQILKPGGVVLATVPAITKISPEDMDQWGQYWSFTSRSARQLFEEAFAPESVVVEPAGNVLAATAFLQGIAAEELSSAELDHVDAQFELLLGIRAAKQPA
jgi:SAM-dependent methyltransferase